MSAQEKAGPVTRMPADISDSPVVSDTRGVPDAPEVTEVTEVTEVSGVADDADDADDAFEMIPAPRSVEALGDLSRDEIHNLKVCEDAVEYLGTATWLAGKALHAIQSRRLYRDSHSRFDDYVKERWEISPRSAYQMIEEWPLAARINGQLGRPAIGSHIRALIPVSRRYGDAAAADLYQQLYASAAQEEVRLTAVVIAEVVRAVLDTEGGRLERAHFEATARQIIAAEGPQSVKPALPAAGAVGGGAGSVVSTPPQPGVQNFADLADFEDRAEDQEARVNPCPRRTAPEERETRPPSPAPSGAPRPTPSRPTARPTARPAPGPGRNDTSDDPYPSAPDSTAVFLQSILVRVIGVERDLAQNIPPGARTERHDRLRRELAVRLHRAAQHLMSWSERDT
ncbi:hypothetical protein AB0D49_39210 [Streptomyces sp. NPDC048290]|uniref:hypothetical protein n=1 Tax=Streptomyces sp. NPDC048290 TaxID=3155811 RepID=UPI00342E06AF